MSAPTVVAYTDGACRGNPGPGGWAALLEWNGHERLLSGNAEQTTNNRMELTAAIRALEAIRRASTVLLHTDSQYLRQGITEWLPRWQRNGWRTADGRPVKNQDLWLALASATARHRVEWRWVRGHAGDPRNERVDRAARAAIDGLAADPPEAAA